MKRLLLASAVAVVGSWAGFAHAANAGLIVSDLNHGPTPTDLAQSLAGSGVTISNVTYTGANNAAGTFSGGSTIIGFGGGIVLGSGSVQTTGSDSCSKGVEGPNKCEFNTTANGTPGDAALSALSGHSTFDAAILEFDFVPKHSTVQFRYVFSSDEYNEFANSSFNDVFAFYVNGTNCALVPTTTDPVSINTINGGNPFGTNAHHPELYRNNSSSDPGPATIDTEMDGLTVVLECNATVNENVTNHLRLAIADASDQGYDSNVFIEGGSLISGTQIETSLSGGGQNGAAITVPTGTSVTDSATLSGVNAKTATGTVTYTVYSDSTCHTVYASGGTHPVSSGSVGDSDPVVFSAPGVFYWQANYSGDLNNNQSVNACGSEKVTVEGAGPGDTTGPTCLLTQTFIGPPKSIEVTLQDSGSGLNTVTPTSANATVVVAPFASGTTAPVVVTAAKNDPNQSSSLALTVTDVAGNVTKCDPVFGAVPVHRIVIGVHASKTVKHIRFSESKITIGNALPGLRSVTVVVNGRSFHVGSVATGTQRVIDVHSALRPGSKNVVTIRATGAEHATATIVISS